MYKPFDFDPSEEVSDHRLRLPGPADRERDQDVQRRAATASSLAQFGFIVIEVGNRGGNPQRSKWYHNYGYGNLRDYGLADKKAAIEQLAQQLPVHRHRPRRHLRPLGRRLHVGGGDARLPGLLQGRRGRSRATTRTTSTTTPGARSTTASRKSTRTARSRSSTTSRRTRSSPRT